MKRLLLSLLIFALPLSAFATAYTSSGSGDWDDAATWGGGGTPGTGDTATVANTHKVTVDSNIACGNITIDSGGEMEWAAGTYDVVLDGGSVFDNNGTSGAVDIDTNDPTLTFKSTNTTHIILDGGNWGTVWSWSASSQANFEYVTFRGAAAAMYVYGAGGAITAQFNFNKDVDWESTNNANSAFYMYSDMVFAAGYTYSIYNSNSSYCSVQATGDLTATGSSGNEINFNSGAYSQTGYLDAVLGGGETLAFTYCNFTDMTRAFFDQGARATITFANCNITGTSHEGLRFDIVNTGTVTISDTNIYSCGADGLYIWGNQGVTLTVTDSNIYSNTSEGIYMYAGHADFSFTLERCKVYGNTSINISEVNSSGMASDADYIDSLIYEGSSYGMVLRGSSGTNSVFNCTVADCGANDNIYVDLDSGDTMPITNTISSGASRYGINAAGADDPVVTYCNVTGSGTADYNGMTDPTGSDGNIDADPLFVNAAGDDYSLQSSSSSLNAGTSTGAPANDITDTAWANANPDIGCYTTLYAPPTGKGQVIWFF